MNIDAQLQKARRCLRTSALALADDDPEAACNRAYYAMFNAGRAALFVVGQPKLAMAKTHSGLVFAFGEHLVKAGHFEPDLGRLLALESKSRIVSDYDGDPLSVESAADSIANATHFVSAIDEWIALRSQTPQE